MSVEVRQRAGVFADRLYKADVISGVRLKYAESLCRELCEMCANMPDDGDDAVEASAVTLQATAAAAVGSVSVETKGEVRGESGAGGGGGGGGGSRSGKRGTTAKTESKSAPSSSSASSSEESGVGTHRSETHATEKAETDALEKKMAAVQRGRNRRTDELAPGDFDYLVTMLYGASATFSYCADRRRARLWHEACLVLVATLAAAKESRKRSQLRGMAMMFHPTNGRNLFQSATSADLDAQTTTTSSPSPATEPEAAQTKTLEWTPAIEAVIVADIVARLATLAASAAADLARGTPDAKVESLAEPRGSSVGVGGTHVSGSAIGATIRDVLRDYGVCEPVSDETVAALLRKACLSTLSVRS
jgi:hypothetical protein